MARLPNNTQPAVRARRRARRRGRGRKGYDPTQARDAFGKWTVESGGRGGRVKAPRPIYGKMAAESKAPLPPTVEVVEDGSPCGESEEGCTGAGLPIYLRPVKNRKTLRENFYHELGHQFDYQVMTDRARQRFCQLIRDPRGWDEGPNSPHEKFAEAYKDIALYGKLKHKLGIYGYEYNPSPRLQSRVRHLLEVVASNR